MLSLIYNVGSSTGAAIASIQNITGDFIGNYAQAGGGGAYGGAIYNYAVNGDSHASIQNITGDFIGNYAQAGGGGAYGGAIYNCAVNGDSHASIQNITGDFIGNYAIAQTANNAYGGAIYNVGSSTGAAIASIQNITGDFIGNYAITKTGTEAWGGAIFNGGTSNSVDKSPLAYIGTINGDFRGNYTITKTSSSRGGAVMNYSYANGNDGNHHAMIDAFYGDFIGNYAVAQTGSAFGGAIHNWARTESFNSAPFITVNQLKGDFIGNYVVSETGGGSYGGAISNYISGIGRGTINVEYTTGDFIGNYAIANTSSTQGGAIYNYLTSSTSAAIVMRYITGDFIGNYAKAGTESSFGGAFYNHVAGSGNNSFYIEELTGNFIGNYTITGKGTNAKGGAIYNYVGSSGASSLLIKNLTGNFIGNYAIVNGGHYAFGGAIHNAIDGGGTGSVVIENLTGNFIGNYAIIATGTLHQVRGGAIFNSSSSSRNQSAVIKTIVGDFVNNGALVLGTGNTAHGGAVYNYAEATIVGATTSAVFDSITGDFTGNYALVQNSSTAVGGAIMNFAAGNGSATAVITLLKGDFTGNYAIAGTSTAEGGAIRNYTSSNGQAIAIIERIEGNFTGNYAIANDAVRGGAIYNSVTSTTTATTPGAAKATIDFIKGDFTGNYAIAQTNNAFGGALRNTANGNGNAVALVNNIEGNFTNNYAIAKTGNSANGGAIYNYVADNGNAKAVIKNITGDFTGNYAQAAANIAHGGAIYNYSESRGYTIAAIDNISGNFTSNYAIGSTNVYGGAISNNNTYNDAKPTLFVTVNGAEFRDNHAIARSGSAFGGAIYNYGPHSYVTLIDSSFIENSATTKGGAIYNNIGGTIYIISDNKDVLFDKNTVGVDTSNAIHNLNVVYLNANNNRNIVFNDAITGETSNAVININQSGVAYPILNSSFDKMDKPITQTKGTVEINNTVTGNTLNLYDGSLKLGENGDISGATLNAEGGQLSLIDNQLLNKVLGTVNLNTELKLGIDINLDTQDSDKITINNFKDNGYKIAIDRLNIIDFGTSEDPVFVTVADENLRSYLKFSENVTIVADDSTVVTSYLISYNSTDGTIRFEKFLGGIMAAIKSTNDQRVYTMVADESVADIGAMNGESLIISGGGNQLIGESGNNQGISVAAGQSLGFGTITITGFDTAITNVEGGTVSLSNVIFRSNDVDVRNDGTLIFDGEMSVSNVNGSGLTIVQGDLTNAGRIKQSELAINSGASLTTDAQSLDIANAIENAGTLVFSGNTSSVNNFLISGIGTLVIEQNLVTSKSITQNTLRIAEGRTLEITDPNVDVTINYSMENNGIIINNANLFVGGDAVIGTISGTGTLNVIGNVTVDHELNQSEVSIHEGNRLVNNAGINANVTSTGTFDNNAIVNGTINNSGSLLTDASYLNGVVTNTGTVTLESGTLAQNIIGETGNIVVEGEVVSNAQIDQNKLSINSAGEFTTNAADLKLGSLSIVNDGILNFAGEAGAENINIITTSNNRGTLNILSDVTNSANITQQYMSVAEGAVFTNNAELSIAYFNSTDGEIANNATFTVRGETAVGAISGTGTLISTHNTNVNKSVVQDVIINQNNSFANNAADGGITAKTVINKRTGTNDNYSFQNNQQLRADEIINTGVFYSKGDNLLGAFYNGYRLYLQGGTTQYDIGNYTYTNDDGEIVTMEGELRFSNSTTSTIATNVSGQHLFLSNNATVVFSETATLDAIDTTAQGGTLSLQNEYLDTTAVNVGDIILNNNMYLKIDVDLAKLTADKFVAKSVTQGVEGTTYNIIINGINILADTTTSLPVEIAFADEIIREYVTVAANLTVAGVKSGISYLVGYDSSTGNLLFDYGNLYSAVHMEFDQRVYTVSRDETANIHQANMEGENTTMYITGLDNPDTESNGYFTIKSANYNGITVSDGQTLNVSKVNLQGFSYFISAQAGSTINVENVNMSNGTDINNSGTLTISGVNTFKNIINNATGTATVSGENTIGTFSNSNTLIISGTNNIATLTNSKTVNMQGTNVIDNINNASGSISLDSGSLSVTSTLTQNSIEILAPSTLETKGTASVTTIVNRGAFNNSADLSLKTLENHNKFDNSGISTIETLTNNSTITNSGRLTVTNLTNSGVIENAFALVVRGAGTLGSINGKGTLYINADSTANKAISQTAVNVAERVTLTNSAGIDANITNSGTFDNNALLTGNLTNSGNAFSKANEIQGNIVNTGTITFEGGTYDAYSITGEGTLVMSDSVTNKGSIIQNDLNINTDVTFRNDNAVVLNNDLFNEGTIENDGTLTIAQGLTSMGSILNTGTLSVKALMPNKGTMINRGTFAVTSLQNEGHIENYSSMTVRGVNNLGSIVGTGTLNAEGILTADKAISQASVTVLEGAKLINEGSITADVVNKAEFDNNSVLNGTLTSAAVAFSNASNLKGNVVNTGSLTLEGGTYGNFSITGDGTTIISADTTNTGSVSQTTLAVEEDVTYTNNATTIVNSVLNNLGTIANTGNLTVYGENNLGSITGLGTLNADGTLTANENITQGTVSNSGTLVVTDGKSITASISNLNNATLTSLASGLIGDIVNAGNLNLTGGEYGDFTIAGQGSTTVTADTANSGSITQNTFIVNENVTFTNNNTTTVNNTLTNSGEIANLDTLTVKATNDLGSITGTGILNTQGTITANENITQSSVSNSGTLVIAEGKTVTAELTNARNANLTASASSIVGPVSNAGTINFSGGTTQGEIKGYAGNSGTINVNGDLNIAHAISANTLVLNDTTTTNLTTGSLNLAGLVVNGGVLNTQNNVVDNIALGNVVLNNNLNVSIDADLSGKTPSADYFQAASINDNGYNIIISNIIVLADPTEIAAPIVINIADAVLKDVFTLSADEITVEGADSAKSYYVTYSKGATSGYLTFGYGNLSTAIAQTAAERQYNLREDEASDLGVVGSEEGTILTINGNNFTITANPNAQLDINEGITVNLNNATVKGANTAVVLNKGTFNAQNITFSENTTDLDNSGTANFSGMNTLANVANSGTITFEGINSVGVITGEGTVNITSGSVSLNSKFEQDKLVLGTGAELVNNGDVVINKILENAGNIDNTSLMTVKGTNNLGSITGLGTLYADGILTVNKAITQGTVVNSGTLNVNADITAAITNESVMTSSASNLKGDVANSGTLNLAGGEYGADYTVSGEGSVVIEGNTTNLGAITQNNFTVNNGVTYTNSATTVVNTSLTNSGTIANENELTVHGTNNLGLITGEGTLYADGDLTADKNITQATVSNTGRLTVADSARVTAAISNLKNAVLTALANSIAGNVANAGTIKFTGGEYGAAYEITGEGSVVIEGNTTNLGAITQNNLTVNESTKLANNKTVIVNALLSNSGEIANEGTLTIKGTNDLGSITGAGTLNANGTLTVNKAIEQGNIINTGALNVDAALTATIDNKAGALLTSSGSNLKGNVSNAGTLNLAGGEYDAAYAITGEGSIVVTENSANSGSITQNNFTVNTDVTYTNSATTIVNTLLSNAGVIANEGTLTIYGTNNLGSITGAGTLFADGDLTVNKAIEQASISNSGTLNVEANVKAAISNLKNAIITASGSNLSGNISNAGTLNLAGGEYDAAYAITGEGSIIVTENSANSGSITQNNFTVNADKTFTNNNVTVVNNVLSNSGAIANEGTLTIKGTNDLGSITGAGTLNTDGTLTVNKAISQGSVINSGTLNVEADIIAAVTNNSVMTSSASNLKGNVSNSGTLNFAGGEYGAAYAITGEGSIIVTENSANSGSITQNNLTVNADKTFTNNNVTVVNNVLSNLGTIANEGTLTIKGTNDLGSIIGEGTLNTDGTLTVNKAISQGSVINSGTLNVNDTVTANVSNKADAVLNTSANSIVGNIANSGTINFSGGVTQGIITGSTGTINVNGNLSVAHAISGNTLNLANNTTTALTTGSLNLEGLVANGGKINAQNGQIDRLSLGNVTLNSDLNIAIDTNLAGDNPTADFLSASSITANDYNIVISSIMVLTDPTVVAAPFEINVADSILRNHIRLTNNAIKVYGIAEGLSFSVTYAAATGNLVFGYGDLYSVVHLDAEQRSYTLGETEYVDKSLNEMGGENATLTINGNYFSIVGDNVDGITVNEGQTLNVNDVTGYRGFNTAIFNSGNLNITNVTFGSNTTDITNTGILSFNGNNTVNIVNGTGVATVKNGTTTNNGSFVQNRLIVNAGAKYINNGSTSINNGNNAGTLVNKGTLNITANTEDASFTGNNIIASGENSKLNLAATENSTLEFYSGVTIEENAKLDVVINSPSSNGTVKLLGDFTPAAIDGYKSSLNSLTMNGGTVDTKNNTISTIFTDKLIVNADTNYNFDISAKDGELFYDKIWTDRNRENEGEGKLVLNYSNFENILDSLSGAAKLKLLYVRSATNNFLTFTDGANTLHLNDEYYVRLGLNGSVVIAQYNEQDDSTNSLVVALAQTKAQTLKLLDNIVLYNYGKNEDNTSITNGGVLQSAKLTIKGDAKVPYTISTPKELAGITIGAGQTNPSDGTKPVLATKQQIVASNFTIKGFEGAFINNGGKITLTNVNMVENETETNGAAIRNILGTATVKGSKKLNTNVFGNISTNLGGAFYNESGTMTLSYVKFGDSILSNRNEAYKGGAVFNGNKLTVSSSTFENNFADTEGGAIYTSAYMKLASSTFTSNEALNGGAVYVSALPEKATTVTVSKDNFYSNKADENGGALYVDKGKVNVSSSNFGTATSENNGNTALLGGAIYNALSKDYPDSLLTLKSNKFAWNNAELGGVLFNEGSTTLTKNSFGLSNKAKEKFGNTANLGGAIYNAGNLTDSSSTYMYNEALTSGGAIYNAGQIVTYNKKNAITGGLNSTKFTENKAVNGGAIYNAANLATSKATFTANSAQLGGAFYNAESAVATLISSTFIQNTATSGGAIYNDGTMYLNKSTIGKKSTKTVNNSNRAANGSAIYNNGNLTSTGSNISYNEVLDISDVNAGLGTIYNTESAILSLVSTSVTYNTARFGGGIYNLGNVTTDYKTKFTSNTANSGGAIYNMNLASVQGSALSKNSATNGGALFNALGATMEVKPFDYVTVSKGVEKHKYYNPTISSNMAKFGGGIYNLGTLTVQNTTFSKNSAIEANPSVATNNDGVNTTYTTTTTNTGRGGAIYNASDSDVTIVNSTFTSNKAGETGGAIHNESTESSLNISGSTFKSNTSLNNIVTKQYSVNNVTGKATKEKTVSTIVDESGKGGAIYSKGQININKDIANNYDIAKRKVTQFTSNSSFNGGAIYSEKAVNINSATFTSNSAKGNGGALYVADNSSASVVNSDFSKNTAVNGGAIYAGEGSNITIKDTSFLNNTATDKGGAIYADKNSTITIEAIKTDVVFKGNKANKKSNSIYLNDASLVLNAYNDKWINIYDDIDGTGTLSKSGNVFISNESTLTGITIVSNSGNLMIANEANLQNCSLVTGAGSGIQIANNSVRTLALDNLTLNGTTKVALDMDLKGKRSDNITANNITGTGSIDVNKVNLTSNSKTPVTITVADGDSVIGSISATKAESAEATYKLKQYVDENGMLRAVAYGQKAKACAVAAPVAAQLGGYLTQINSYDQAFMNMDMNMLKTREERKAEEMQNRYALTSESYTGYSDNDGINYNSKGLWTRPYATFERVNLNNGPKVGNIAYGNFFGGDADMKQLNNGWRRQFSACIGYNGSVQDYNGQSIDQNGGNIGITEVWYKRNFFTGLTLNVGGNVAQATTDLGKENMPMVMAGIASKTGYNFEFKEGKFILQPSFLISYSFVHTFAHDNGLGNRVSSSPLNAIQVAPGMKFIFNLQKGWQPYLAVNMRWNIIDKTHFALQDVSIPDMSIDPYVEYGLGLQRRWGERFTGFGQAMIRNGGRNGVMLSFGFKWLLGK